MMPISRLLTSWIRRVFSYLSASCPLDHHREGEFKEVVICRAGELRPEEGRESALLQEGELVRVVELAGVLGSL
jgi:hypothetical protein